MDADVKALWVASLRDGSFKQGKYQLRSLDDKYDPSGVLCELVAIQGVIPIPKRHDGDDDQFQGYSYNDGSGVLATYAPTAVLEWAGIGHWQLMRLNHLSDKGMKFDAIANYIEENY